MHTFTKVTSIFVYYICSLNGAGGFMGIVLYYVLGCGVARVIYDEFNVGLLVDGCNVFVDDGF